MDQDASNNTTNSMQGDVKGCGCTAGADGGPCDACKAGKHHECNSDSCTMREQKPTETENSDQG